LPTHPPRRPQRTAVGSRSDLLKLSRRRIAPARQPECLSADKLLLFLRQHGDGARTLVIPVVSPLAVDSFRQRADRPSSIDGVEIGGVLIHDLLDPEADLVGPVPVLAVVVDLVVVHVAPNSWIAAPEREALGPR
jgi:hypothetical protein